jgi:hypothetical protein
MELNDKFKGLESKLKIAGATLITLVVSGIIAAGALSIAVSDELQSWSGVIKK